MGKWKIPRIQTDLISCIVVIFLIYPIFADIETHLSDPIYSWVDPYNEGLKTPSKNYVISPGRLAQLKSELLYPFFDQGGGEENTGDYQKHIRDNSPQITKHLNFHLPFFGFGYNYTWVSLHGYLAFSDGPTLSPTYPLVFPEIDYPKQPDPSFIGPFYSKCKIGELSGEEVDPRRSGVYFRLELDLPSRTDQFGVELRERLQADVREGIVGAPQFVPQHAMITTWKNVTFAGGTIHARKKTNTFQLVLATDEVRTYAIFNYKLINWTTHTEAGGSSEDGTGGVPAYVGFNAGNGTGTFEYKPYSQGSKISDLVMQGEVNNLPGRHIFRVDEKILPGQCTPALGMEETISTLTIAPESGNMLGGTVVNVTGPCFDDTQRVTCRFNMTRVPATVIDKNRATCIMPRLYSAGYIDLFVEVDDSSEVTWKGKFFVETPFTASEHVYFPFQEYLDKQPETVTINWDAKNLTLDQAAQVSITLWGYREATHPDLVFLDTLVVTQNTGKFTMSPEAYQSRMQDWMMDFQTGILSVNATQQGAYQPVIWSRPVPLAWYLHPLLNQTFGPDWPEKMCDKWINEDRFFSNNFTSDLEPCPCNMNHAISDKGRFFPDQNCNQDSGDCYFHEGAQHCVRSSMATSSGASQQCCYDFSGKLMLTVDNQWGGRPGRAHDYGQIPWNRPSTVPSLSHFLHDISPFFPCCMWQQEDNFGCLTLRKVLRPSDNCEGYQEPVTGSVLSHKILTFAGLSYIFNGKGNFVLAKSDRHNFTVTGVFEELPDNPKTTSLTSVKVEDGMSPLIEFTLRPKDTQWRYALDVKVDQEKIFFDRYPQKIQTFPGVTLYTPVVVRNQSHVIAMFESGVGVECIIDEMGHMTTTVYLPGAYQGDTTGLLGTSDNDLPMAYQEDIRRLIGTSDSESYEDDYTRYEVNSYEYDYPW